MKKTLFLLIAISLGLWLKAQCPLSTAVDFTATDCHGTEVHLFDILDGGQYVLIDFFFYNCSACNTTAPMMARSYEAFGCNQHDVFYMEISDRDSDAVCQNWTTNYGIDYPTISGSAGGTAITSQYAIAAWPTVILIAPDHSIVIHDLWPINNAQSVITALENYGIQQHDCNGGMSVEESNSSITLFPNPANESLTLKGMDLCTVSVYNALGQMMDEFKANGNVLNINTTSYENGVYFIKAGKNTLRLVITH